MKLKLIVMLMVGIAAIKIMMMKHCKKCGWK
jgi:hypothetical protein